MLLTAPLMAQLQPYLALDFEQLPASATVKNVKLLDGIYGKAARFNGYTSEWDTPSVNLGTPDSLFIEAWIAPQEYSFNVSAVVNQTDGERGFLLGLNHVGRIVGIMYAGGAPQECISDVAIPLLKWSHIAMTYRRGKGMALFVNGVPAKSLDFVQPAVFCAQCPVSIGKSQVMGTPAYTERASSRAEKTWMRFNGLIDGLHINSNGLQPFEASKAGIQALEFPKFPTYDLQPGAFGAYYAHLKYDEGWDSAWKLASDPDIVVRFPDSPIRYVFWHGTGYIPAIVTENNIWMTDQSLENFGSGECYEVMGDKQCRYSHVRIIESTPARCVIHWRYALAGIKHQIIHEDESGWGDWADEYWTIYPDGVGVRKQILHSPYYKKSFGGYQFQETIIFNQPGQKPQDNLEMRAIQFADLNGDTASYSWAEGSPKEFKTPVYQPIQIVNTKSHYRPFSIFYPERTTHPFTFGWIEGYSTFPCWNHWPVSQIRSDGRNAVSPDRASHTSITATEGHMQIVEYNADSSRVTVRQMVGMTTSPIQTLIPLARSWNFPPELKMESVGVKSCGYDAYQRAYIIEKQSNATSPLKFTIEATDRSPLCNAAFVLSSREDLKAPTAITVNGKKLKAGKEWQSGLVEDLDGYRLIVWLSIKSEKPVAIAFVYK